MINFSCSHCGRAIRVKPELAGKRGKCPGCGEKIDVPLSDSPPLPEQRNPQSAKSLPATIAQPTPIPPPRSESVVVPATLITPPPPPPPQAPPQWAPNYDPPIAIHVAPTVSSHVTVNNSSTANSFGIASLVVGVISLIGWCVPGIGIIIAGLGGLLGVTAIILAAARGGRGLGYGLAGTVLSGIGFILGFAVTWAFSTANDAISKAQQDTQRAASSASSTQQVQTSRDSLRLGDFSVTIDQVSIEKPELDSTFGDGVRSNDPLLVVRFRVTNNSQSRKSDYIGFVGNAFSQSRVTLVDNVGNEYRQQAASSTYGLKESVSYESIYPGKVVKDAVAFELPVPKFEHLVLTLSGAGVGEEGDFRIKIPRRAVQGVSSLE